MTHSGLVPWSRFLGDFDTLAGRFQHVFDPAWPTTPSVAFAQPATSTWSPAVDIYDQGEAIVLEAELPGHKRDEISIQVENGVLYISGERRRPDARNENGRHYLRSERSFGTFTRSFSLPSVVDASRIEATFRDGILTLTLPKSEAARPRQIDVKIN